MNEVIGSRVADAPSSNVRLAAAAGNYPTIGTGFSGPYGGVVDRTGSVYVADYSGNKVYKITPGGVQSSIGSGFNSPADVAIDSVGNIYVANNAAGNVKKVAPDGTVSIVPVAGSSGPIAVVEDTNDNLYVSDINGNTVYKVTKAGVQSTVTSTGLSHPIGMVLDAANNLYIASRDNNTIVKVTPGGVQTTVGSGWTTPDGLAFDNEGDFYVAQQSAGTIVEVTPDGAKSTIASGFLFPAEIFTDNADHLYVPDNYGKTVSVLTVGPPPTSTPVPPTSTPVPPTSTPVPPTSTATSTPVPPTSTATNTATSTATSTATATNASTSTATSTATNMPVPPTNTATSTATNTNTATSTATNASTSTATVMTTATTLPSLTGTETPVATTTPLVLATAVNTVTGTPSPSATTAGCTAYFDVVYGVTFESACLSGETATNVTITPPSLLHSSASLSLPSITVGEDGHPTLPLPLPDFSFALAGFNVRATGNVLGSKGLSVTEAVVTLPSDLGGGSLTGSFTINASGITGFLTKSDTTLMVAGFTTTVKEIRLGNNGLSATGVTLTLPPTFNAAGKATTLTGEFQVTRANGKNAFSGLLSLAKPSFSAYGFVVSAASIDLTEGGLTIANPSLHLPASFHKVTGVSVLALSRISLSSGFKVSAQSEGFSFTYAGAHLTTGPVDLSSAGIGLPGASITLPKEFGGKTFTLSPSTIGATGDIADKADAKSKPLRFKIADMIVTASGFSFDKGALTLASATATLPAFQDSLTLQGLSFDGSHMSIAGGGAKITLPTIKAAGFNISASASLLLTDTQGDMTYDFVGSGTVVLKSMGALHVTLELGSIAPRHPSNLYSAELDLQIRGVGTPIAGTPLLITGLRGAIHIQPKYARDGKTPIPGSAIYTFSLGLHLKTDDDGFTYHGDATATVASDGNFSFGTQNSQLFKVFTIKGGVCIRVIAQPDNVCSAVLPLNGARVDQSPSTGFYAEISVSRDLENNGRTISIGGSAYAHIWADGAGPELAATADVHVVIPASALKTLIPPFGISVKASAWFISGG